MTGIEPGRSTGKLDRMAEWLDAKLLPSLGPPQIGPHDAEPDEAARRAADVCPVCTHSMGEHQIDRSHPNAVLTCPVEAKPKVESSAALNEVGMPKKTGVSTTNGSPERDVGQRD